jgi:hypothetical protein
LGPVAHEDQDSPRIDFDLDRRLQPFAPLKAQEIDDLRAHDIGR